MASYIHPLSDVHAEAIGDLTNIWQFTVVLKDAVIGENCNINCNCFVENDVIIGNNVTIKSGVQIWDGIRIEDDVFIGPNVTFTNDLIPRSKVYDRRIQRTILKKGSSIGANSTIIGGIVIGEKCLVGAGSVLTKSILPYTVWYGNPAVQKGYITDESCLLSLDLIDKQTGDTYYLDGDKPIKHD
ncbi:MAG TPA: acyltransferase [Pedobacter sp.]|uniref:acyltransferase n=1 Tax=Pedobacter sp. TaxID=1411316 RepID=UPI002C3C3E24|nr:acyltransferase [Pedobacter sp.]HMI00851.1 acyltransferase [Pedobacter sp.]